MTNTDEDEWEYEYDEDETEDFYIPIDLSNVPAAQVPLNLERRPGHPTILKSRLRALNAIRGQPIGHAIEAADAQGTSVLGEVQVVGLHTTNPLVMYNGQLLSCQWTSSVGTDMFFVKPDPNVSGSSQPLRSLPALDLLALGSAKLVAKVGRLQPRDNLFDNTNDSHSSTEVAEPLSSAPVMSTGSSLSEAEHKHPALNNTRPAPTSFLARLNQAKIKRGDASLLAISQTSDGSRLVSERVEAETSSENGSSPQSGGDVVMGGT